MSGVFAGFATIAVLIGIGMLLAHLRIVDAHGQRALSLIAFYVANPALLLTVVSRNDVAAVFSGTLVALVAAVAITASIGAALAISRRDDLATGTVAVLCGSYANAGNLGLPIAAYVLGDAALVAPLLLLQLAVLQPLSLVLLDIGTSETRLSAWRIARRPLTNPLTLATLTGLALAATETTLPAPVLDPLELVGGMAVPSMLIAYGISLRLGPLPGRGVPPSHLMPVVVLKLLVQPVAAYLVARHLLGLDDAAVLAVTVLSALPTAQNIFVAATRYERGVLLARDAIFVSTVASVPVVLAVAALLA